VSRQYHGDQAGFNHESRKHFDWILCFGADMLVPRHLADILHKFAEYALLREVNSLGHLLGTKTHVLIDAVQRSVGCRDLLSHTSVVLICRPVAEGPTLVQEYAKSTCWQLWGYALPECLWCGNGSLNAHVEDGFAKVTCLGCHKVTDGPGVKRPEDVVMVEDYKGFNGEVHCWKPLLSPSPWIGHVWK
jgi:hypothetical protein